MNATELDMSDRRSVGFRRSLTPRERDVLVALADGRTRFAAAVDLGLAPATVRNHLEAVYQRLGVDSLVGAYSRLGWLAVPA